MEVTRSNFRELLPKIKADIQRSSFISIDCELTGLNTGASINAFDTQAQYYDKVRKSAKDFLIIQYGVCLFRYDKEQQIFKQQAYSFYVFPKPINRNFPDHRFLCQASCMDFLINQGFDFNKLFKEGISYLNSVEEDKYREGLMERQKLRANQLQNSFSPQNNKSNYIAMSVEEKASVDEIFKKIDEFMESDQEEMNLPRCNAYIRRLVYQEAPSRIDNKVSLETRNLENKDRVLCVTRLKSKEEKESAEKQKIADEEEEFMNCVGFSEVIRAIVSSEKLVVGHNVCLDLLHTIDKFLMPLPHNYEEFKDMANSMFCNILDTKYMCNMNPFKDLIESSVLSHLIQTVAKEPFQFPKVEVEEGGNGYQLDMKKEHEAGYDAYVTGLSALAMWKYLGSMEDSDEDNSKTDPFTDFSLLEPYRNRLYLMRLQDAPYIHLGGKDPTPTRDHVLHITFPKDWKLNDIQQLFSPFGNVYVAWIDERSAYVGLQKREQTAIALSTLSQSDTYTVIPYAKRQEKLSGSSRVPYSPAPLPKKKRSSDGFTLVTHKKRRTASVGESSVAVRKRSFEPIEEDPETDMDLSSVSSAKKTFVEDNDWND